MSFSTPTITNPATKYIEWKSSKKAFQYYDKEKKESVEIALPFKFIVLDELTTIRGFDQETESSIFSNDVKFTPKQELYVRSKKGGEIASGIYKDIKPQIVAAGGKYTRVVYANVDGEIVKLLLSGSALSYLEDMKGIVLHESVIKVAKSREEKKGSNEYNVPMFEYDGPIDEKVYAKCLEMDAVIQEFLKVKKEQLKERLKEEQAKSMEQPEPLESAKSFSQEAETATEVFAEKNIPVGKEEVVVPEHKSEIKPEDLPFKEDQVKS